MPPVKKQKVTRVQKKVKDFSNNSSENAAVSGQLNKKLKKDNVEKKKQKGVVLLRNLPVGFFEEQMKKYFSQFGRVTRLRLARSRRTGGSKGFGYIEFEYPEVAQVAAETMNNYLMFKKIVKAVYIPPEEQHFNYFKTSVRKIKDKGGKAIYTSSKVAATRRNVNKYNDWSNEHYQNRTILKLKKLEKLNEKYRHLGIDFSQICSKPPGFKENKCEENSEENENSIGEPSFSKNKNKRNEIPLNLLLDNTINDDSDDEDYIAMSDESNNENISEHESSETWQNWGSNDDENYDNDRSSNVKNVHRSKVKVDSFERLIKRKNLTGGIKKTTKKNEAKKMANNSTSTKALQFAAAQEIAAKPLRQLREKMMCKNTKKQKMRK